MKKLIAVIFVLCLLFGLAACGMTPEKTETEDSPAVVSDDGANIANADFPDLLAFTADTLNGAEVDASIFEGHELTAINFWGTYCGPCLAEMPDLSAFAKSLPSRVQLVTFCVDALPANVDSAKEILEKAGFEGMTLISATEDLSDVLSKVMYIPTTLFFDENGRCVGEAIIGGQEDFAAGITARINEILSAMGKDEI